MVLLCQVPAHAWNSEWRGTRGLSLPRKLNLNGINVTLNPTKNKNIQTKIMDCVEFDQSSFDWSWNEESNHLSYTLYIYIYTETTFNVKTCIY
jgi:hypothetical protein